MNFYKLKKIHVAANKNAGAHISLRIFFYCAMGKLEHREVDQEHLNYKHIYCINQR